MNKAFYFAGKNIVFLNKPNFCIFWEACGPITRLKLVIIIKWRIKIDTFFQWSKKVPSSETERWLRKRVFFIIDLGDFMDK